MRILCAITILQMVIGLCWLPPQEDVEALARMMYGECRGVESDAEKAACAWVVCNRVDAGYADDVIGVVSAPGQFAGYDPDHPLEPELLGIARDVLIQWHRKSWVLTPSGCCRRGICGSQATECETTLDASMTERG